MATRRIARRHSRAPTLPLAAMAGFVPAATYAYLDYKAGGPQLMASGLCARLTGFNPADNRFHTELLWQGIIPIGLGILAHKYIGNKLGVNRALANAGVPLLRL